MTVTVIVVEPFAGTVTLAGTVIRSSPELSVQRRKRWDRSAERLGVNFVVETAERLINAVGLFSVM